MQYISNKVTFEVFFWWLRQQVFIVLTHFIFKSVLASRHHIFQKVRPWTRKEEWTILAVCEGQSRRRYIFEGEGYSKSEDFCHVYSSDIEGWMLSKPMSSMRGEVLKLNTNQMQCWEAYLIC